MSDENKNDQTQENSSTYGESGADSGAQSAAGGVSGAENSSEKPTVNSSEGLEEWKARVAYLAAEVENMRKRFAKERGDIIRSANEELLKRLLPVFDNLELATKAAKQGIEKLEDNLQKSPVVENLVKGVEMTYRHFEQTLESVGVKTLKSVGEAFNPTHHEAVGQSEEKSAGDNKITQEFQKGFDYNGRILRPARVIVNRIFDSLQNSANKSSQEGSTLTKENPSS